MIKLLAVLAIVASAALLGAPRAQAIDQCHAPCLTQLEACDGNCLKTHGGQTCLNACSAGYSYCFAHIVCTSPTQPLQP